jgi:pyridoxamine 5'-phosphate oxidase
MSKDRISAIRNEYSGKPLTEQEVGDDPMCQFDIWMNEALESKVEEPTAMVLSTVTEHATPKSRVVLLKGVSKGGFVFFTNYNSDKGRQLRLNPNASLLFFWSELARQVRIEGRVEMIADEDSAEYFLSRPYESQLGAWASNQSEVISDRSILENRFEQLRQRYPMGTVPKPPHWGGFILVPSMIEFWQGRESRLHDRIRFRSTVGNWIIERLSP